MKLQKPNLFLEICSIICIIAGSFALSLFYLTSWMHTLLFDTNAYLTVVTPLPKNEAVSKALSTYTVDQLFRNINVEEKIRSALPDQADFLASPLTEQLQNRSYQRTNIIIQSDQFTSIWVAANTVFHQKILNIVRGGGILSQLKEKTSDERNVQFDGRQIAQTITNRLGSENQLFTNAQVEQFRTIVVPTYARLEYIRQIVYWISQLTVMLFPTSLGLILFGIAISFSRQKALLTASITIIIIMLVTLLALQIMKTDFLNQFTQSVYTSAAVVVWDSFLTGLKKMLWLTILFGLILIGFTLSAGSYKWAVNFRKTIGISYLQKSKFVNRLTNIRLFFTRYGLWFILLGTLIAVIILFTLENIIIANVVVVLSSLLIYLAILLFIFPRQRLN